MSDIDPATAIRNLCEHIGNQRATNKPIKHRFFYYNYTNDATAIIDRDGNPAIEYMDYMPDYIVRICNKWLGNTTADVEAAVACEIAGDWSDFDTHFVRQGAMDQLKLEI